MSETQQELRSQLLRAQRELAAWQARVTELQARLDGAVPSGGTEDGEVQDLPDKQVEAEYTDCLRIEEALRASEARFRLLIEQAPVAIMLTRDGICRYANKKWMEYFRFTGEAEVLNRPIIDFIAPGDRQTSQERIRRRTLGLAAPREFETVGLCADGSEFPVHVAVAPIQLDEGLADVAFVTDITAIRETWRLLEQSEVKFHQVFETSPIPISINRPATGEFVHINPAFERVFGYTQEEILGKTALDLNLWKDEAIREKLGPVEPKSRLAQVDGFELRRKSGEIAIANASFILIDVLDEVFSIAMFFDITERKQAEEALRASEAQYRDLLMHLQAGVVVRTPDTRIVLTNDAANTFFGINSDQTLGKTPDEHAWTHLREDGSVMPFEEYPVNRVIATGQPIPQHVVGIQSPEYPQGKWALITGYPRFSGQGQLERVVVTFVDITERKRAEQALQASELKFRRFVEESAEGIILTDENGRITEWNRSQEQLSGLSRSEVLGQPLWEILYRLAPEARRAAMSMSDLKTMLLEFAQTGRMPWSSKTVETEILRTDGTLRMIEVVIFPIASDRGYMSAGVIRDVTENKRIEAAERDQRALAEALRDTAEALARSFDPDTVMAHIQENISRVVPFDSCNIMLIKGDTAEVVYCQGWEPAEESYLRSLRFSLATPNLSQMLQTRKPVFNTDVTTDPNWLALGMPTRSYVGAPIEIHGSVIGFLNLDACQSGFYTARHAERLGAFAIQAAIALENAQLYDQLWHYTRLLEQRVDERTAELRRAKEHVETILNSSSDGIILVNVEHGIRQTNPAFDALFACDRDAYLGKPLAALAVLEDAPYLQETLLAATCYTINRLEVRARRWDGTVFDAEIGMAPVLDPQDISGTVVCTLHDITQRKQAALKEKELGDLKIRFLSMASHEFRTPLATILAASDSLTAYRHRMTDDQIDQKLIRIKEQVGFLRDIMDDVLLLARMQARRSEYNPEDLDIDVLCQSVIEEFQSRPDVEHQIGYVFDGLVREARLDKKLMRQIVGNLVGNAIKYSSPDRPIDVRLETTPDALVLRVSDQGIGIPDDDLPRLFEPFHRGNNVGNISGTGLGLAVVKDSVDMHRGTITVESHVDVGTTFSVNLPLRNKFDDEDPGS